jgi:hypothetical protein
VKKNGEDRHWAGLGKITIEAAALREYLKIIDAPAIDSASYEVSNAIVRTDINKFSQLANAKLL